MKKRAGAEAVREMYLTSEATYSLEKTLYPSFILPFFSKVDNALIKVIGRYAGARIIFDSDKRVIRAIGVPYNVALEWTGLWYDPFNLVKHLPRSKQAIVYRLLEVHGDLRLSVSSIDWDYVFVSVFLSQNTDFHVNTCRWLERLVRQFGPLFLEKSDLTFTAVGSSYQLRRADCVIGQCLKIIRENKDLIPKLRRALLSVKYVGPKVVDSFILFGLKQPESVAVDIHLKKFARRIGITSASYAPRKNLCSKYDCWYTSTCPMAADCIRFQVMREYKQLAGWVQTIAYYHDKVYCSAKKCANCPLREMCQH